MSLCEDCGEEAGNHSADCPWWGDDALGYDCSLDPISPHFDIRSWG
jgi:hypothetical protein